LSFVLCTLYFVLVFLEVFPTQLESRLVALIKQAKIKVLRTKIVLQNSCPRYSIQTRSKFTQAIRANARRNC
jgi:hypothetical protein